MKLSIEESIIASLRTQISKEDLLDEQWLKFKDKAQENDRLWYFRTPDETWTQFFPRCGMEGYALVRGEKVIEMILTSLS